MWTINSLLATAGALDTFKQTLNSKLECSDSGPAGYFLGFNIYRKRPAGALLVVTTILTILDRFDLVDCLERVALTAAKHLLRFRPISASPSRQNLPIESSTLDFAIIFCARESTTIKSVFLMFPQQTTLPITHQS